MNDTVSPAPFDSVAFGSRTRQRFLAGLGALVLVGAIGITYERAVFAPFIFDDASSVIDNPSIVKLWPLFDGWEHVSPLLPPRHIPTSARPLVNLSLAINYHFGQLDPRGYHLVNIGLHAFSAMLLWAILWRTLQLNYFQGRFDRVAAFLAWTVALLWALHPLTTESVTYVTQRSEVMMGMFYLATLYGSLRYWAATARPARAMWLTFSTITCVSGMLSKEMMVSAPVIVLLFERTLIAGSFRRSLRQSWPLYLGLMSGWLPLLAINYHGPRTPLAGFGLGVPAYVWWFTQAKVLWLYLKLSVWPWPLVIHYEVPYLDTVAEAWPWLLSVALLALATAWLLWRRSVVGLVAIWVLAILSPTLVIPLPGEVAVERRMYLPLAALVALAVVGGYELVRRVERPVAHRATETTRLRGTLAVAACFALGVAVVLSLVSVRRLAAYHDELTLWQDALCYQPNDPLVHVNLGVCLNKAGHHQDALEHFLRAVKLDPNSFQAHYNLARALEESGRPQDAMVHYKECLRLKPDYVAAHNNLGILLANSGRSAEAIEYYENALSIEPDFGAAHNNLGIALARAGRWDEALVHFRRALSLKQDAEAYANLAFAYAQLGQHGQSIAMAEKAVGLARDQGDAALARQLQDWLAAYRNQVDPR